MSQSSVQGSVTLRKLRTGATASVSLSSTMQLFQLYQLDSNNNASFAPDWTGAAGTFPVVTVNAVASQGSIEVTGVLWKINNTQADSLQGVTASTTGGVYSLSINTNLGDLPVLNFNSGTLIAEIAIKDESGATQTITKAETIRIQKSVSDGYNVMINCNKSYVDSTTSTSNPTTLTAVCYRGMALVQSGITFKWFATTDPNGTVEGTGGTYSIINPDKVNGSQLFVCRAYIQGVEVDAEAILIVDNSDPYYLTASVQQSKGGSYTGIASQDNVTSVNVADDHDATKVTFKVQNANGTDYGSVSSWTVEKRHADTLQLIGQVASAGYTTDVTAVDTYNTQTANNTASVSIDVYDADYSSVGQASAPVAQHDTEVVVTATATL